MKSSETPLIVRYAETDAQGVVHHSNYLVWFEEGRSDFLRQNGLRYTDFEKAGYFVVVVEAEVKYKAPAFYEDRLRIKTTLSKGKGKLLEFTYHVLREDDTLLAEGRTVHLILDEKRNMVSLPVEILERIT